MNGWLVKLVIINGRLWTKGPTSKSGRVGYVICNLSFLTCIISVIGEGTKSVEAPFGSQHSFLAVPYFYTQWLHVLHMQAIP